MPADYTSAAGIADLFSPVCMKATKTRRTEPVRKGKCSCGNRPRMAFARIQHVGPLRLLIPDNRIAFRSLQQHHQVIARTR